MAKIKLPTFKNSPRPSGLASVSWTPSADIKLNKKKIGYISVDNKREGYLFCVRFAVPSEVVRFKWVKLKATFESLDAAKNYIKDNWNKICEWISEFYYIED